MNTSTKFIQSKAEGLSASQKGFAPILLGLIIVGVVIIVGAALWANYKNGHLFSQSQQDQTPQV